MQSCKWQSDLYCVSKAALTLSLFVCVCCTFEEVGGWVEGGGIGDITIREDPNGQESQLEFN